MIKEKVQRRIIEEIKAANCRGIVLSSVRSGKTRILLTTLKEHSKLENPKVLVLYPNIDIKNSWLDECAKIGCPFEITYSTFVSMEKVLEGDWDYVIFDEAHLIPVEFKLPIAGQFAKKYKHVIFASGTYNSTTLADIKIHSGMDLIVNYTTEDAIDDGIISNYTVFVHFYSLNSVVKRQFLSGVRKWWNTDVDELRRLTKSVDNSHGERKMIAALSRMRFINTNDSLLEEVQKWIKANPGARFLMFTENEKFGKKFRLPMFNSKSKDDVDLKNFIDGHTNQLCLIRKGSAGITYPNLSNILITSINSNGENLEQMLGRALLKDTEHSDIHIFVTDKRFQLNWLESALNNISEDKIVWLNKPEKLVDPD